MIYVRIIVYEISFLFQLIVFLIERNMTTCDLCKNDSLRLS